MSSSANSRARRSWMISMCSSPRKPQRNPKPKATELSGSKKNDESFSRNFSRASRPGVLVRIHGIKAGENHGLDFFKAGQRLDSGIGVIHDGVANFRVGHVLDVGNEEADFAGAQLIDLNRLGSEYSESFRVEGGAVRPQPNSLALTQSALKDACQDDDAAVRIEPGVENQRL